MEAVLQKGATASSAICNMRRPAADGSFQGASRRNFASIVYAAPIQMLAYHAAVMMGKRRSTAQSGARKN